MSSLAYTDTERPLSFYSGASPRAAAVVVAHYDDSWMQLLLPPLSPPGVAFVRLGVGVTERLDGEPTLHDLYFKYI